MPSLSRFLNALSLGDYSADNPVASSSKEPIVSSDGTVTAYYLAAVLPPDPSSSAPLLQASPRLHQRHVPPGSILFGFTHPLPHLSASAAFFLACLPDPIGYLAHSASFIRSYLGTGSAGSAGWRHNVIHLTLEDEPGLAYTSGGHLHVSLQWAGDMMREVERGDKEMSSAILEFKGVLLHELVHAIQYDGLGSTPVWLTESIADYVRLKACLGPPHWRNPGQGHAEKGWEDGYDAGAQFLLWLVEDDRAPTSTSIEHDGENQGRAEQMPLRPSATVQTPQPQSTQYPTHPAPPMPPHRPDPTHRRPGPWPDFVRNLNTMLELERYDEGVWVGLTGHEGGLAGLWAAYLGQYK